MKFSGYAPDASPTDVGVIYDCEMLEPSARGMRSAPSAAVTDLPALAADCRGATLAVHVDGSRRLIAGTQTALLEAASGTWSGVSSATYTGGTDARWSFAQFGDVTIATNGVDSPQSSTSGAFATATGMPKAKLVTTASGFVMAANITDASYQHADGWWCSALYDHTSWTPAIATQAARGRLLDAPGAINALVALGSGVVAFKDRSMFHGSYVGPDVIWAWSRVPGEVGAAAQSGVVSDGTALYWWGGDDFYRYDGSRPVPIGAAVKRWFAASAAQQYLFKMLGHYDRASGVVRWYFVGTGDSAPAKCLTLHVRTGRWGRADRAVEAVVEYVTPSMTYDSAGVLTGVTYDSGAFSQSYDSPFWQSLSEHPAVFDSAHTLRSLTGVSGASSLTTGDVGDDDRYTLLRRVRPRYSIAPDTAQMTAYLSHGSGDSVIEGDTMLADDGKFDPLQSARWHRLRFNWTGDVETSGISLELQPEGDA